jgi:hypothetical protein
MRRVYKTYQLRAECLHDILTLSSAIGVGRIQNPAIDPLFEGDSRIIFEFDTNLTLTEIQTLIEIHLGTLGELMYSSLKEIVEK